MAAALTAAKLVEKSVAPIPVVGNIVGAIAGASVVLLEAKSQREDDTEALKALAKFAADFRSLLEQDDSQAWIRNIPESSSLTKILVDLECLFEEFDTFHKKETRTAKKLIRKLRLSTSSASRKKTEEFRRRFDELLRQFWFIAIAETRAASISANEKNDALLKQISMVSVVYPIVLFADR